MSDDISLDEIERIGRPAQGNATSINSRVRARDWLTPQKNPATGSGGTGNPYLGGDTEETQVSINPE